MAEINTATHYQSDKTYELIEKANPSHLHLPYNPTSNRISKRF